MAFASLKSGKRERMFVLTSAENEGAGKSHTQFTSLLAAFLAAAVFSLYFSFGSIADTMAETTAWFVALSVPHLFIIVHKTPNVRIIKFASCVKELFYVLYSI
jgi:hypothetical protein